MGELVRLINAELDLDPERSTVAAQCVHHGCVECREPISLQRILYLFIFMVYTLQTFQVRRTPSLRGKFFDIS